jgi:TP901 family phage tail tape measure protein
MKEAAQFAESTQILMNVSEFTDVSQATDTLISSVQAFGYTAETSMDVVDLLNTIGNNYAISTADLAQSLTKSSASLVAAGGDLAEAAALTATANKIIQDADSVGTALKTTSLRLRGTDVKVLEEEGLDSEGAVTSKSKLQSKVKALSGVDILTQTGEYKSTYEILVQIAEVWESMNDMDQAALLELIAGKRNSSVVAAILQNPEELKEAFEDANNASGSALKENEKYMDSIQGKIDQFTNATQSMWSNFLDADVVKFVVDLGTKLIKLVDTLGLIPSILIAIGAFKGLQLLFKGADLMSFFKSLTALTMGTKVFEAETRKASLALLEEAINTKLVGSSLVEYAIKMNLASAADVAKMTTTQLLGLSFKALGVAIWGAVKAVVAFLLTNPVGWAILAIGAIAGVVAIFNAVHKTAEELAEELGDLKSELADLESEIDSLNSELKTAKDRMAELIAMPSLSFIEQEELENLKQTTAELERQIKLKEVLGKNKEDAIIATSEKYINQAWHSKKLDKSYYIDTEGKIHKDEGWGGFWNSGENTKELLDRAMTKYQDALAKKNARDELLSIDLNNYDELNKHIDAYNEYFGTNLDSINWNNVNLNREFQLKESKYTQEYVDNITEGINMVLNDEAYDDLEYGMSEDIDKFLDERYAYLLKWRQAQGEYVKSDAISSMFDATSTKEMQAFGKALQEIADSDLTDEEKNAKILEQLDGIDGTLGDGVKKIDGTTDAYNRLHLAMETVGVTAQDIADYFVLETGAFNSDTMEGIIAQYELGLNNLKSMKDDETLFNDLFDADGEVIETKVAEMMKGADETTREEFSKLLKSIKDGAYKTEKGLIDWGKAMESFSISGGLRGVQLAIEQLGAINIDVFPGLEDEIKGIIDTFDELIAAVGNTVEAMDTLEQARAEEAYSGSVSLETLEKLMQSTDNYADLIEVDETGAIKLAANAQDILVQEKINTIKKNAELALSSAQLQLAEAKHNQQIYQESSPAQEVLRSALAEVGAAAAFVTSLWNDLSKGNLDGAWARATAAAKTAKIDKQKSYAQQAAQATTSVTNAEKAVANAEKMVNIANNLTPENIKGKYDSDEASGGNKTKDEVMDDAFQKAMEYWENRIAANQAKSEQVQNEIDLLESKGQKVDASFYEEQIKLENERKWLLEQQKEAALAHLDTLAAGSEKWWEVANTLNDIESELDDVTASIVDLQDAIGEIDTYKFEEFNNRLDDITSKLGTIRDLIAPDGEEDWFSDDGAWTEAGVAVLGSHIQELETYKQGYQDTIDELDKYQPSYEGNEDYYAAMGIHSEQEYYDRVEELTDQQYGYAQSISDTEQSIVGMYESSIDAVEEYTDKLIDSYNDYIDSVKEALDAERDLYDFKKNVQKQAKDIAEIERRIMSLSGSTNAADIAERRRLEADLYGAREDLDDTYYDHAKESQQNALDSEAEAYEESMTNMIEGLRVSLEEATLNMDEFLMGVTSMVMYNADTVLSKYEETNLPLTKELTNPWEEAKKATNSYSGNALDLMNQWTKDGGFFAQFNATGTTNLKSPWSAGTTAANSFKTSVSTVMSGVVSNIATNVRTASGELSKLYQQIQDTEARASSANVVVSGSGDGNSGGYVEPQKKYYVTAFLDMGSRSLSVTKSDSNASAAMSAAKVAILGEYEKVKGNSISAETAWQRTWRDKVEYTTSYYAKGTTGTSRDEWAITDEFGPELKMYATPEGNLSFMALGSTVVPHDLTMDLIELPSVVDGLINRPNFDSGINMISNAINKPEIKLDIENFLNVGRVDQDTLPALEKMMDKKINEFSRQLNYALKGKGAR